MRFICFLFLFALPELLSGQNRYWVAFTDKANSAFSISNPETFLSQASIQRRVKNKVALLEEDLPVNTSYIQNVKNTIGVKILYALKWFNGVVVQCDAAAAQNLTRVGGVKSFALVAVGGRTGGRRGAAYSQEEHQQEERQEESQEENELQRKMIGLNVMNASGFYGEGINVAVFDNGFAKANSIAAFAPLFSENRVKLTADLVTGQSVYDAGDHGVSVWSVMAATSNKVAGSLPKANYFLFHTEEQTTEYRIEEYNWMRAMEMADSAGVHLINSSLGYSTFDDVSMNYSPSQLDGNTAIITQAASKGVSKGMVVVVSVGNVEGGRKNILFPADARGVIAVGSVDNNDVWSAFSTTGPTADGRVKPDVVAPGVGSPTINSSGNAAYPSGTSFASPLIACLAGGILQAYPELTAAQVVESILSSANKYQSPTPQYGYGLPHFLTAKSYIEKKPMTLLASENRYSFYPNPMENSLSIKTDKPSGLSSISLWDNRGRIVFQTEVNLTPWRNSFEMDVSFLAQGFYYVKIKSSDGSFVKRIMKK